MKAQEMALRNEIRQMMNEAGINRNNIKEYVKSIVSEIIERQVNQAINEHPSGSLRKYVEDEIKDYVNSCIKDAVKESIKESMTKQMVTDYFSKLKVSVEFPKFEEMKKEKKYNEYTPTCPRGYEDCVNDPAYIHCKHPGWYREMYGDLTPEQVSEKSCKLKVEDDPDEKFYCYDDEDK
jgi:hypothetical protein